MCHGGIVRFRQFLPKFLSQIQLATQRLSCRPILFCHLCRAIIIFLVFDQPATHTRYQATMPPTRATRNTRRTSPLPKSGGRSEITLVSDDDPDPSPSVKRRKNGKPAAPVDVIEISSDDDEEPPPPPAKKPSKTSDLEALVKKLRKVRFLVTSSWRNTSF